MKNLLVSVTLPHVSSLLGRIPLLRALGSSRVQPWLFAGGLGFAFVGQFAANRPEPIIAISSLYDSLDGTFKLQFPNREAPLEGFALLLVGAVLFGVGVRSIKGWQDAPNNHATNHRPSRPMSLTALLGLPTLAVLLSAFVWIKLDAKSYSSYLPVVWLASLLLLGIFFWRLDRQRGISLGISLTLKEAALLTALVAGGLIVPELQHF